MELKNNSQILNFAVVVIYVIFLVRFCMYIYYISIWSYAHKKHKVVY